MLAGMFRARLTVGFAGILWIEGWKLYAGMRRSRSEVPMVRNEARDEGPKKIDLERVAQLIDAMERDLAKVQSGSRDVQLLRDEVETLKNVLNSPIRRPHWVREGLHGMRQAIENGLETVVADGLKAGQYIAEIGRILGM